MFKKNTALFIPLLLACSSSLFAAPFAPAPQAVDDNGHLIVGVTTEYTGNVMSNDKNTNGASVDFKDTVSIYGRLSSVDSTGEYTYTVFDSVDNSSIPIGETVEDIFPYVLSNNTRGSSANLIISLSTVNIPTPVITSNVDIEVNDQSFQATPLNSGKNILGQLQTGRDKDWFSLPSAGNEVITFELCPQSSGCFGKKSWVLYVFDSDRLTGQIENQTVPLSRWVNETGQIVSTNPVNHMYLSYRSGIFDNALIGVIDPCFDTNNTVSIGVGSGSRNYLIAISSPLLGDTDGTGGTGADVKCGGGSVVLERPGAPAVLEVEVDGVIENQIFETTEQFISIFPSSDDQYSITVTGTGTEPLLSDEAAAKSATFNPDSGELIIPKVRVNNELISARLNLQNKRARSANGGLKFGITVKNTLDPAESDAFQGTYDPATRQVILPRVTLTSNGEAYSAILKYYSADNVEVIEATKITEK